MIYTGADNPYTLEFRYYTEFAFIITIFKNAAKHYAVEINLLPENKYSNTFLFV